jgi:hypothetical protein
MLHFNFTLQYAIRRIQVNRDGLKLNGTHQLLAYADNVNILDGSLHTTKENAEALVVASKESELEVNADKTMYMNASRDQNAGRNRNINIGNNSFVRVEEFKYLGRTLTNQNSIQEEITKRSKPRNAFYFSVQNLLSSNLLSKNLKIKIHKTIILSVDLYGCETWSLTLREERRLMLFENKVLSRIIGPVRDEVTWE